MWVEYCTTMIAFEPGKFWIWNANREMPVLTRCTASRSTFYAGLKPVGQQTTRPLTLSEDFTHSAESPRSVFEGIVLFYA